MEHTELALIEAQNGSNRLLSVDELSLELAMSTKTLYRKIKELEIEPKSSRKSDGGRDIQLYALSDLILILKEEEEARKSRVRQAQEKIAHLLTEYGVGFVVDFAQKSTKDDVPAQTMMFTQTAQNCGDLFRKHPEVVVRILNACGLPVTLNKVNVPLQLTEAQVEAVSNAVIDEAYKLAAEMETGVAPDNETTAVACRDTAVALYVQQPAQQKVVQNIAELIVQANDNLQQEVTRTEEAKQQVKDADRWLYASLSKAQQEYVDRLRKTEAYRNESVADILSVRRTNKLCAMVGIR